MVAYSTLTLPTWTPTRTKVHYEVSLQPENFETIPRWVLASGNDSGQYALMLGAIFLMRAKSAGFGVLLGYGLSTDPLGIISDHDRNCSAVPGKLHNLKVPAVKYDVFGIFFLFRETLVEMPNEALKAFEAKRVVVKICYILRSSSLAACRGAELLSHI